MCTQNILKIIKTTEKYRLDQIHVYSSSVNNQNEIKLRH